MIASRGHGSGGHFHSLMQVSSELSRSLNVGIVVLGTRSPVLEDSPLLLGYVPRGVGLLRLNRHFRGFVESFNPDVVHCFDTDSLNTIHFLPSLWNIPIVLNKCGGPNPKRLRWQYADCIVNFSLENHLWFKSNDHYADCGLFLIPNRVSGIHLTAAAHRTIQKEDAFCFVRIQRIGAYQKTVQDCFNLLERLRHRYKVHFYLIGRVQSSQELGKLEAYVAERQLPVTFVTDKRASRGSELLYLADCVIGTGRSFMEAASLGVPVLAPARNLEVPVLVNEENFQSFFECNFSERTSFSPQEDPVLAVESLIENRRAYEASSSAAKRLFEEYFGPGPILAKYSAVYAQAIKRRPKRLKALVRNLPFALIGWVRRTNKS